MVTTIPFQHGGFPLAACAPERSLGREKSVGAFDVLCCAVLRADEDQREAVDEGVGLSVLMDKVSMQ